MYRLCNIIIRVWETLILEKEIMGVLIGGCVSLLGFALSEVFANIRRKNDQKERFLMSNYTRRQIAYEDMYISLNEYKDYFDRFIYYDNEFIEHENKKDFAPLEAIGALRDIYEKNEIWLHNNTAKKIEHLLQESQPGCNLAQLVSSEEEIHIDAVEPMAENIVSIIEDLKIHMKKIIGILMLDDYQDEMLL